MKFEEVKPGSFIYRLHGALLREKCEEIVHRFESRIDEQAPGRIGQNAATDQSIKKTTDLRVSGKPHWQDVDRLFFDSVGSALGMVSGLHPFFARCLLEARIDG